MNKSNPNFVAMRPYGSLGDEKNDGYDPTTGTYYQVYAPTDPDSKLGEAASKARDDFAGLLKHWKKQSVAISNFEFAFNDEFGGSVVPVQKALDAIKQKHKVHTRPFLAKDLEKLVFKMPMDDIQEVLGFQIIQPNDIGDVDFGSLREVAESVLNSTVGYKATGKLLTPALEDKLNSNNLSAFYKDCITRAAYQTEAVEKYLGNRAPALKQTMRDCLEELYVKAKTEVHASGGGADEVMIRLTELCAPADKQLSLGIHTAVMVILAYYFESCDIFEPPNVSP
ncbi:MAG: hypothetical protein JNK72_25830 [Myxococcales bacterium]|nr:hypothetical protein [Myxococcales bacterium]